MICNLKRKDHKETLVSLVILDKIFLIFVFKLLLDARVIRRFDLIFDFFLSVCQLLDPIVVIDSFNLTLHSFISQNQCVLFNLDIMNALKDVDCADYWYYFTNGIRYFN